MSHSNQLLLKRLERKINSLGGGELTTDSVDTTHIANGTITTADISDHAITYEKIAANAVTNTKIANLAVTHAKLSSNCVESHNIVDRTILGIDISLGQIGEAHFDASFTAQLSAFAVALDELSRLQGVITIKNNTSFDQSFSYKLFYKHSITLVEDATEFIGYTDLNYTTSASHFFKLPSALHLITLKVHPSVSLEGYNVYYGGEDNFTGNENNQDFLITDVNVLIECEVATS
jgi:hypothetical protein